MALVLNNTKIQTPGKQDQILERSGGLNVNWPRPRLEIHLRYFESRVQLIYPLRTSTAPVQQAIPTLPVEPVATPHPPVNDACHDRDPPLFFRGSSV